MNKPKPPEPHHHECFASEAEEELDQEALRLSGGDMALWLHHRALLMGEWVIYCRGKADWSFYQGTKKLAQFPSVEESVIAGWRKFAKHSCSVSPDRQRSSYAINCAIVLKRLRASNATAILAQVLRRRAGTFYVAAKNGDLDFFRAVGRLLGHKKEGSHAKRFEYSHAMLWRWLTDYYWLMPAKLASGLLASGLSVSDKERTFLSFKTRYALKSHSPPLIDEVGKSGLIKLSRKGGILLG